MSSLRKLQRLSANERRLLTQALVLLPLTFWGVYALGVSRWQSFLNRLAAWGQTSNHNSSRSPEGFLAGAGGEASERAITIARTVKIAAERGIFRANCLQQALVLGCLLRRNHIESEIRFGARKEEGKLLAHAWVEVNGLALNEATDVCMHFSPLAGDAGPAQIPQMPTVS